MYWSYLYNHLSEIILHVIALSLKFFVSTLYVASNSIISSEINLLSFTLHGSYQSLDNNFFLHNFSRKKSRHSHTYVIFNNNFTIFEPSNKTFWARSLGQMLWSRRVLILFVVLNIEVSLACQRRSSAYL